MKHNPIWMIIGYLVPLLLIFVLPLFGIKGNYIFLIFFLAMVACHFLMMGMHGGQQHGQEDQSQNNQDQLHQHYFTPDKEKTL